VSGAIDLTKSLGEGTLPEARVGVGTLIGELALIIDVERPVTATAVEAAEIMRIRRTVFHRMMAEYPEIAVGVRNRFAERLAATGGNLERVGRRLTRHDR
ncbi:MAG: cyclic nucleotide-binding domain-containing protein, partial [Hyphomicrobiales bacterium]|nr:cyclic nucleotide-binding domain-containing protein [Hyphomicrobiales bacterium]